MIKIDISALHDKLVILERLYYEQESYQKIVQFMIQNGLTNMDQYRLNWEKFIDAYVKYAKYKDEFNETTIIPQYGDICCWHIDFDSEELIINE